VVTCVLAIMVESRYPSRQELTALIMLTFGVMLAVWQVCDWGQQGSLCCEGAAAAAGSGRRAAKCAVGSVQQTLLQLCCYVPMSAGAHSLRRRSQPPLQNLPCFIQGTISGKPYAIAFCLVGTVCNGAMMTFSGKVSGSFVPSSGQGGCQLTCWDCL